MFITAKVIKRLSFKIAMIFCLRNVVCGVILRRGNRHGNARKSARVLRRRNMKAIMHLLKAIMHLSKAIMHLSKSDRFSGRRLLNRNNQTLT